MSVTQQLHTLNNSKKKTSQGDKKPKYALWKKYETRKNVPLHAAHRQNTNMQLIKNPVWDDYKGAFKYTFGSKEDVHYYENEIKAFKLDMKRLVVAEWIKDFLSENFNLGVDGVITNGFNFKKFDIGDKEFPKDRCTISMIYSTLPVKAMDDGFKVLESVKKKNPSVKILLFGFEAKPKDAPFSFEYIRGAAGEEVRDIYKRTDIFFCPSHQEGFHNPPSEAMAGKCAVLATSVGSVPFTMNNMINGLVSEPKDINDMINKMNMLVENRELRIQLSMEANKTIKNLKWDDSIDKLINIFESR